MSRFLRIDGLSNVPAALRGCALAIGNFDGVHRGHQEVLGKLRAHAAAAGAPAVAMTFEPHPRDFFAPAPVVFRLTPDVPKAELLEAIGLDGVIVVPFDDDFIRHSAEDYIDRFLVSALGVSRVVVGQDFRFGSNRLGTPQTLLASAATAGFEVEILEMTEEGPAQISSTRIREALGRGDLEEANRLLGYHWFITGEVVRGDQRGRELGYPTANLATPPVFELFQGIYAVRAKVGDRLVDGVAAYGKPMFDNTRPPFEVHLFDFTGDLYGQRIEVALVGLVRGQEVFSGLAELIAAMDRDSARARKMLAAARPLSALDERLGFFG